jgi:hypothetical protein
MVSICAQDNSNYDSSDLASSDVFVKLSQHTSVEMSDFTVFVLVFLSYYLHLQSLKYHVSEMIIGSQSIVNDSIAAQSRSNVATKLQQSKTFDISLAKIYTTLTNEEKLRSTKLFGQDVALFKILIPLTIAAVIFIVFLSLTGPVWPSQLGGENLVIIGMVTAVASLGLSYFVLTVETPALMWIVLVSIAFAVYAVVKTSNCDPNKVCLYKPDGYGDNFLDFNPLWIFLAFAMFVLQKIVFSLLLSRHGPFRILRGISFMFFLLFYAFMIVTTFHSSPETKHHQYIPCTSKGSFVGQLIYWPLFLIIVFYIERGSYTFKDEIDVPTFGAAIITYIISALLFIVPISTILGWEGNRETATSRMTCSLRQPTISLDTPDLRCCKTQKVSSSSLRTFDIHYNNLSNEPTDIVGSNVTMSFELLKIVNGNEEPKTITESSSPLGEWALQLVRGDTSGVTISNGETLGPFQIALKAGPQAFDGSETEADYILRITFQDQSRLSFYQRFSSITHDQSFTFLRTDRVERYSLPDAMPDGNPMPSGTFTVRDDGVVINIYNRPLMSDGNPMDENHTIRNDNVILDTAGNPVQSEGQNLQVVRGTAVVINQDPSETEKVVGCTSRNEPRSINLRGNLEKNNFTPGSGINPISFTGRHANTGPGMGAFWGFIVGTAIASTYLGITNATKALDTDTSRNPRRFGVAGLLTGIAAGSLYGGIVGAPSGAISGAIVEVILANIKGRQMRFEYLDENNYPVARVAADDKADTSLQKVPLNSTHTAHEWRYCSQSSQTATSSVDNENCNGTDPPPIEYTPPEHCKYLADFKIDFSNYPDTTVEGGASYGLKFNANTGGSDKVYIHFHQDKANDPIFGTEGYMYWLIFVAFLIVFTFLMQAGLLLFGKEHFLSKRLQNTTKIVYKGTEGVAQGAERLRTLVRGSLDSTATRAVARPTLMTRSTARAYAGGQAMRLPAVAARGVVDVTSSVAGGLKRGTGAALTGLGGKLRAGGEGLYDRTIRPVVAFKDSRLLTPRKGRQQQWENEERSVAAGEEGKEVAVEEAATPADQNRLAPDAGLSRSNNNLSNNILSI